MYVREQAVPAVTDWSMWRLCPVCRAPIGQPCLTRSGRVVGGRVVGPSVRLDRPHAMRRLRTGMGR